MGTVTLRDSVEKVGDASISTVEYVFSDIQDFILWESSKRDAMNQAVKSFVDSQLFGGFEEPVGDGITDDTAAIVDINVKPKKEKLH